MLERQRERFQEIAGRERSDLTNRRYDEKFKLLIEAGEDPIEYCRPRDDRPARGRRTYYVMKAAWQRGWAQRGLDAVARGDQAAANEAERHLLHSTPDYAARGAKRRYQDPQARCLGPSWADGQRRPAKRVLSPLPDNWRMAVQGHLPQKYHEAGLVSALCGCRAVELEQGVRVRVTDDRLELTVRGAKRGRNYATGDRYGQQSRTVQIDYQSPLAQELFHRAQGRSEFVVQAPAGAWGIAVRRASEKCLGTAVGPNAYRHQFSADLKAQCAQAKAPREKVQEAVARAMGHSSERSQCEYGESKQGRGGGCRVTSVSSTSKPRRSPTYSGGSAPSHSPR